MLFFAVSRPHTTVAAIVLGLICLGPALAQDAYCTLTKVTTAGLSNGATVTVEADGMLEYRVRTDQGSRTREIIIDLENARSGLASDLVRPQDTNPISFISFTIPDDATNGIGLRMRVELVDFATFQMPDQSDPQKLTFTIRTERTIPRTGDGSASTPSTGAAAATGEGAQELEVTCDENGMMTLRALKADIHRVVAELARSAGVNVAVDDAVRRKVSMNLTGLTPQQVLQGIASGYGLALSSVGDTQMLSEGIPTDLPTYGRSATTSYPLTYVKVDDAASLLPPFLIEYLRRNPQQNSIVVTAPRQMLDKIGRDLRSIDVAPPLIMVEVVAMEVTRDGSAESFLRWAYGGPDTEISGNTRTGEVDYEEGDSYGIAGGVVDTETLSLRIRGLMTSGSAKIHAQPRMAALNGETANIFIGRDRFIRMTYSSGGDEQERIETVRVGVSLVLTPWTGGNGEITSRVECEVSNIVEIDADTGIPRLSTRRAEANVRARDGETIIIGGLLQRQQERTERRIPILGDLPLIGQLFRSADKTSTDTELVFLLTPRIIDPDAAAEVANEAVEQLGGQTAVTCPAPLGATEAALEAAASGLADTPDAIPTQEGPVCPAQPAAPAWWR